MNNQAAQTMPELPDPAFVTPDDNLYTVHQMRAMYQQGYAAALSQTAGVAEGMVMVQKHDLEWIVAHVLDECDGSGPCADLAARRVRAMLAAAPAASGGEDELDRAARRMGDSARALLRDIAEQQAAASVSERARVSLDLNNLPAEWPWDEGSPCLDPRPVGMVYPAVPTPRAFGYLDKTGVEWAAYDTGQMEEYGRRAFADGANTALRALEQALTQQREAVATVCHDTTLALVEPSANLEPGTKLYTTPQPSADAVRELVQRWRDKSQLPPLPDAAYAQARVCARELESLLAGGGKA